MIFPTFQSMIALIGVNGLLAAELIAPDASILEKGTIYTVTVGTLLYLARMEREERKEVLRDYKDLQEEMRKGNQKMLEDHFKMMGDYIKAISNNTELFERVVELFEKKERES